MGTIQYPSQAGSRKKFFFTTPCSSQDSTLAMTDFANDILLLIEVRVPGEPEKARRNRRGMKNKQRDKKEIAGMKLD